MTPKVIVELPFLCGEEREWRVSSGGVECRKRQRQAASGDSAKRSGAI